MSKVVIEIDLEEVEKKIRPLAHTVDSAIHAVMSKLAYQVAEPGAIEGEVLFGSPHVKGEAHRGVVARWTLE